MKRKMLPLIILLTGCQADAPATDPAELAAATEAWARAFDAGDIDTLAGLYATDTRLLPPDGAMQTGRAAVREIFGGMIDAGLTGDLTSVDIVVSGDMGHHIGTFVVSAGDEVVDEGKFIELWTRGADGQWRISADIWNSDGIADENGGHHSHMVIVHEVADADHWLAAWRGEDSRHALFEANGAAHVHTFRSRSNPNLTGLVVAAEDVAAVEALIASEAGAAAAAADGVDLESAMFLYETK
ncbi:MAG: DUF4440 domain-containing protein [Woeseiaceae bacterium]|nr:DUF4440 domain-containing protein [Woeseiaceae bacterium]